MLILKSPSSFNSITDPDILKLIKLRPDQLGDEMFVAVIIIEVGDSLWDIEEEIGFSIMTNLFDDLCYLDPGYGLVGEQDVTRTVSFADFSSRKPGKIFRKNSDYLQLDLGPPLFQT